MNLTDRTFNRLMISGVVIGFMAVLAAGVFAGLIVQRNQTYATWVNHTYLVEQAITADQVLDERLETARRGYLLVNDETFYNTYRDTAAAIPSTLDRIQQLTTDNPAQQINVSTLRRLQSQQLAALEATVALARGGDRAAALAAFRSGGGVEATTAIRRQTAAMLENETKLLAQRSHEQRDGEIRLLLVIAGAGVLVILVGAGSIYLILHYTRDLTRSRAALLDMNENLEAAVDERTTDLKRANDEIQRFAYIVSHDLRSPLVNVMGFTAELDAACAPLSRLIDSIEAEAPTLLTPEAAAAVRQDLPEAVGFIRSSTQKMDRLINAILRLSREGRRVIAPEPLDVAAIVQGVADSLKHRTDQSGTEIRIEGPLPDLISDKLAIEQILSNLIENAVKYLKPGVPGRITVSGHRAGGRVILSVADNGRGIDPRDHERVFDLFRRSGVQDQPGEGIGLAHVRALAYRLGGFITCQSALDQGAEFRVSLPFNLQTLQDAS